MDSTVPYRLPDTLSFCWIDGHPIFLDIQNDRYFRLPNAMEHTFVALMNDSSRTDLDISDLIRCHVLSDAQGDAQPPAAASIQVPSHSAAEQTLSENRVRMVTLLEVFATVWLVRRELRQHKLKAVLAALKGYRERRTLPVPPAASLDPRLPQAANEFKRARLYAPIETTCLLDSLAMVRYLARRGLHASVVFGVALDPFSAHCWVQAGNLLLSDTVGNASAHTPIRMI